MPPLSVKSGSGLIGPLTVIVSFPAPVFTMTLSIPASETLPVAPKVIAPPLTMKSRLGAAKRTVFAAGCVMLRLSLKPEKSVAVITPPAVVTE